MSLYLGDQKIQNVNVGTKALGINDTGINNETTTSFEGILKGENGKVKTAEAGIDYLAPNALNGLGDLANKNKVSLSDLDTDINNKLNTLLDIDKLNSALNNGQLSTDDNYIPSKPGYLVDKKYVDTVALPSVGSVDNGKILQVKNGDWTVGEVQSQAKVQAGSYTGDGTTSRDITLEFAPKVMFILIEDETSVGSTTVKNSNLCILIDGMTYKLTGALQQTNSFSLSNNRLHYTTNTKSVIGNETGKVYNYVLLA